MRGVFEEMKAQGFPSEVVETIRGSVDCNLEFFGSEVGIGAMYTVLCGSIVLLIGIYVIMNILVGKRKR